MKNIIVIYNDDAVPKRGVEGDVVSLNAVVKASEDVEGALIESGFCTLRIGLNSGNLFDALKKIHTLKPCIVFNLCEAFDGDPSKEMNVAALFELLDVAYTGSPPKVLRLTADKGKTKQILLHHNIHVPLGLEIKHQVPNLKSQISGLQFPLIVKPLLEDGSIGIDGDSVTYEIEKLKVKIEFIFEKYKQPAIVEEYIDGREFNVSIIGNHLPEILPVAEIDYSQIPSHNPKILCYKSKWIKDSDLYNRIQSICPADITRDIEGKIKEVALKAYKATGCRDYARIDIRLKEDRTPVILEVNSNPDISIEAGMAKSAIAAGLTYSDLIKKILTTAAERYQWT
ncbi:MAG: ATP-grasp domain-containing protein [Nitrospinae bacterium]|nr:ATP-grasp domain-containing protein [Nitrospinota bacterium]